MPSTQPPPVGGNIPRSRSWSNPPEAARDQHSQTMNELGGNGGLFPLGEGEGGREQSQRSSEGNGGERDQEEPTGGGEDQEHSK